MIDKLTTQEYLLKYGEIFSKIETNLYEVRTDLARYRKLLRLQDRVQEEIQNVQKRLNSREGSYLYYDLNEAEVRAAMDMFVGEMKDKIDEELKDKTFKPWMERKDDKKENNSV